MDPLLIGMATTVVVASLLPACIVIRGRRLRQVLHRMGFDYSDRTRWWTGQVDRLVIHVRLSAWGIQVVIDNPAIPEELAFGSPFDGRRIASGEWPFQLSDSQGNRYTFTCRGPDDLVDALLDSNTRTLLFQALTRWRANVRDRRVEGSLVTGSAWTELEQCLLALAGLARRLALNAADVPGRLAANVAADPDSEIRCRCLKWLNQEHPDRPETFEACRVALQSSDSRLRLLGARSLGVHALGTLVLDPAMAPGARIEALARIATEDSEAERALVLKLIGDPVGDLRCHAVEAAARLHLDSVLPYLLREARLPDDARIAESVARALGKLGKPSDPAVEMALLELLALDDPEVQGAAIESLLALGGFASVEPLLDFERNRVGPLARAARDAVHAIQERLGSPDGGRLSVSAAAESAGALSVAPEGAAGRLSVKPDREADGGAPGRSTEPVPRSPRVV